MKKGWLIGCGVASILGIGLVVALTVVLVAGAFALTRPVVDASEQFLTMLGQGKSAEAYASAADGLRARLDEASFVSAVQQLGLTEYASVYWHNRQIDNLEGVAEGTVTTKGGTTKPVSVQLVRQGGRWTVVGLRYGGVQLESLRAVATVPPPADLERMVTDSLLGFNQAIQARDFTAFHDKLADVWKKEITPERLRQTFQGFIDKEVNLGGIRDVKPEFTPRPAVNDRGVLVAAGTYPTRPFRVRFELEYGHEGGIWKLRGISVKVEEAERAA
jgi:hypothetical protein